VTGCSPGTTKLASTDFAYVPSIDSPPPGRGAGIVEYKPF